MQRREQQKRAAGVGGGGSSYLGGGITAAYSSIPRFDVQDISSGARSMSSATMSTTRTPAFKGSGMKLGSKRTKQAELLDALGGEALVPDDITPAASVPQTPVATEAITRKDTTRGSLPAVVQERYALFPLVYPCSENPPRSIHVVIKENLSLSLNHEGGLRSLELKGDMNLQISDPALSHVRLVLTPPTADLGSALQFKQHPNVAKLGPGQERVVALKDSTRAFPVGQSLTVLKWRYTGLDESHVPLSGE
jgi:hypothetical protein